VLEIVFEAKLESGTIEPTHALLVFLLKNTVLHAFVDSRATRCSLNGRYALEASGQSACWAVQTSRHPRQQSNTDQQILFRNR
jgi:hypothetical protein